MQWLRTVHPSWWCNFVVHQVKWQWSWFTFTFTFTFLMLLSLLLFFFKTLMQYIRRDFLKLHHGNKPTQACGHHFSEVMTQTAVQLHSVSSLHISLPSIKGSGKPTRTNRFCLQRVKKHHQVPLRGLAALYSDMAISAVTLSVQTDWLGEVFHANSRLNISPQLSGYRHPNWAPLSEWSPPPPCSCHVLLLLLYNINKKKKGRHVRH